MRLIRIAAAVFVLAALVGCNGGKFSAKKAKPVPGTFRYPIVTAPTSLDPGVVQDGDTLDAIQQVYEGLVTWSPDNVVIGALAKDWDISPDGRTYTFHLRQGVKFQSGRECKAQDVKWSIERNCVKGVQSPTVDAYLSDVVGLSDVVAKQGDLPDSAPPQIIDVPGIKVIDDYTLSITLKQPTPYFLGKLTYLVSAPMDKDYAPLGHEMTDVSQMVGTGPFKIKSYDRNQLLVLTAFKDYHGGAPKLETIERPVVTDPATRLNKYKNGDLDMVMLERQDIEGLKGTEYEKQLKMYQRPAIWYVGMNQEVVPQFKDRRVRRAIAMAINKERIVNEILGGHNLIANGIIPPGVPGYRPKGSALPYDPTEAKKLLAEAGFPNGDGFPELTMNFREDRPDIKYAAEAVAGDLKENLNISVKLQTMEWRAYLDKYNKHQLGFFHMRWAADYLDPQNFLSQMLATYGPENKIGYDSPEFDRLCREADRTMDMAKRIPLYQQAEDTALNDAVWVPLYFQRDAELERPWVSGMRESLFGHLPHTTTEIKG
ncbi:MAG TPA: peptide ABC transporter substrate-binding protein [Fimbriimonadaceae bacterium]|nr:peptide ABC transporter substrate-binding protein [Fimbriimonadaceae bacterium]